MAPDPLTSFTPQVRDWFARAFAQPTDAQTQAWPAIASGEHVLLSAPTGSGKTLAAFLWALDRLVAEPSPEGERKTRLVYVSPLKALSYDIERNLRAPLKGIGGDIEVAIRTGDTPQRERAQMLRKPPDVLITTPESLYLMLTSRARDILEDVEWVIVDEIHAVAQTKRGAHLALTLERLEHLADRPVQRIGLSATQRPLEEVGRFLVGSGRSCRVVDTGLRKPLDIEIKVPVDDMREPGEGVVTRRPDPGRHRHAPLDLAGDLPRAARAGAVAPVDDHLREQPPRRRAPGGAPERARGRGRRARRHRARPPRLARARGAPDRRGDAEGRRAAVPRRHLVARARHRHGRGRPRAPGRVAEVGHRRPAADRPRRPRRRRDVEGPDLPQVPGRPARVRGRRQAHALGGDRDHGRAAQPARRAGPADRRDGRHGRRLARAGAARARPPRLPVRGAVARGARPGARHARRALPVRGVLRAAPADRLGPRRGHDPRAQGRAPARRHERGHDPRPRPVRRPPARRPPRRRARRGDGLRGAARARSSCSARRPGGSRRSRATA